jgi:site-specific recombinase XerC
LLEGGQLGRLHRSVVLGPLSELPTRRHALTKLEEQIRPVNQGTTRPEASMSFGAFAESQWSVLVLPTLKLSTQHGYKNVLRQHLLPYWREWRLRDIGKLDVQQFVADRFRQQFGWQTVRNAWTLLSGILETAVEYGYLTVNAARGVKFPQPEAREAPAIIAGGDFARLLNELGEPLRESKLLGHVLQPAAKRAGLGRVTWHQFRHIHSSLLNDLGVPVKIAQEQLGHASLQTTLNIYTHVVDASHRAAIDQLEGQLFPTVPKSENADNEPESANAGKLLVRFGGAARI